MFIKILRIKYFLLKVYGLYKEGKVTFLNEVPLEFNTSKMLSCLTSQIHLLSAEPESIGQILLNHFNNVFKEKDMDKLFSSHAIEKEILQLSFGLQMKREIMESYRRFVIFKGRDETYLFNNILHGVCLFLLFYLLYSYCSTFKQVEFLKLDECPW